VLFVAMIVLSACSPKAEYFWEIQPGMTRS